MRGNSPEICSNQSGIHPDLKDILDRYLESDFCAPIHERSKHTFELVMNEIDYFDGPLILDSGCGNGQSTFTIAQLFPDHFVVGIDKSHSRLQSGKRLFPSLQEEGSNAITVRADLVDLWRLFSLEGVAFDHHFLLYQNPWPKKKHIRRRWHAHPVFPTMLGISECITMRTNWKLYAEEFCEATKLLKGVSPSCNSIYVNNPLTPFEKKFSESGHQCYEAQVNLTTEE